MNDFMKIPEITLEMSVDDYINLRWHLLSEEAKKLMRHDREYVQLLWTTQYYKTRCKLLENKLKE